MRSLKYILRAKTMNFGNIESVKVLKPLSHNIAVRVILVKNIYFSFKVYLMNFIVYNLSTTRAIVNFLITCYHYSKMCYQMVIYVTEANLRVRRKLSPSKIYEKTKEQCPSFSWSSVRHAYSGCVGCGGMDPMFVIAIWIFFYNTIVVICNFLLLNEPSNIRINTFFETYAHVHEALNIFDCLKKMGLFCIL